MLPAGTESPPHARGRAGRRAEIETVKGITPACAGKSHHAEVDRRSSQNHPRVRREESSERYPALVRVESPPRARGRASSPWAAWLGRKNHPRMRGEEEQKDCHAALPWESPPRARGRAWRRRSPQRPSSNHPRMRGEESNENAALGDIAIPPKRKFSALFQEPPSSAA